MCMREKGGGEVVDGNDWEGNEDGEEGFVLYERGFI